MRPFADGQGQPYTLNVNQRRILLLIHQNRARSVTVDVLCSVIGATKGSDKARIGRTVDTLRGPFLTGHNGDVLGLTPRAQEIVYNIEAAAIGVV